MFDKIFCLHLVEANERYINCINEFNKYKNLFNDITYIYTCKNVYSENLKQSPFIDDEIHKQTLIKCRLPQLFNVSYHHYEIIKTSYLLGYNYILVFEDDIQFINNPNLIYNTFTNLPDDWDLIKFWDTESLIDINWYSKDNSNIQEYIPIYNFGHGMVCYALSKNGMKQMIELYDSQKCIVDTVNIVKSVTSNLIKAYRLKYQILNTNIFKSNINI